MEKVAQEATLAWAKLAHEKFLKKAFDAALNNFWDAVGEPILFAAIMCKC